MLLTVTRRVSARGAIMVGGQKIQVGLVHARKTTAVTVEADTYQITVEPGITISAARTTSRDIRRRKASTYPPLATGQDLPGAREQLAPRSESGWPGARSLQHQSPAEVVS